MTPTDLGTLQASAMQLPKQDGVYLVERLLASLDDEDEILEAWIAEAERRADAMESGEVQGIPIEEALASFEKGCASECGD